MRVKLPFYLVFVKLWFSSIGVLDKPTSKVFHGR